MVEPLEYSSPESLRILHLDDDPDLTGLTKKFLEREVDAFEVVTETSPADALERLASENVDGIVSDYEMPDTNGLEFLDAVRAQYPDLPFILFTGKGSEEIASEAISRGVTDYLQKGVGHDQYTVLANRLQNAIAQRRAEAEVEERSEWYRRILESSSDYVLIVDEMGEVSYVSPAIERVMGYTQEEIIGSDAFEFVYPEDMERAVNALSATIDDPDQEVTVEFRSEANDGSIRWLEVRGSNHLEDRLINGVMVNVRDITERKASEQELQRQQAFLEHSMDIITVLGADGTIDYVSPSVERVLDYSPEELTGRKAFEFVHPECEDDVVSTFESLLENPGGEERAEFQFRTADGEWCWLDARGSNQLEDQVINGVVINARDISERKEREQEIERQNERLDEFAQVVSHDLRNPLTIADGNVSLAARDHDDERLDTAADALDRMNELIDNLLSLARSGELVREKQRVDLSELAEQCWLNVDTADATLAVESDLTVRAEPSQFRQLLENLFRNAVEHGGSDVLVTVDDLEDGRGFYVEDDGPGVPEPERDRVFESGYSTEDDGTGFGLSIVEQVANAHGWETSVSDSTNGGARFTITGVDAVDS